MRRAFSLIELLIVIVIAGSVYALALPHFQKIDSNMMEVGLKNLKEYMQQIPHEKSVELLCFDKCNDCSVMADGRKVQELDETFDGFFDPSIKSYRLERYFAVQEIQNRISLNPEGISEEICFSYKIDARGIGDQVLVEYDKKVYDYTQPDLRVREYSSLAEALSYKQKQMDEVIR